MIGRATALPTTTKDKWFLNLILGGIAMPNYSNETIKQYLSLDEKILWWGKPQIRPLFNSLDIFYIPASLIWLFFLIYDFVIKEVDVFGFIFIFVGLYFLFGRFAYKIWRKKNTLYVLTNERVIVFRRNEIVLEKSIKSIKHVNKDINSNDTSTLQFGDPSVFQSLVGNTGLDIFEKLNLYDFGEYAPIFYDIQNAMEVFELVQKLRM